MRQYRYDYGDGNARWIDLDRILAIDEPGGVNRFDRGMFYGFAMTLAFQDKPMVILHQVKEVYELERGLPLSIEIEPDKYEDQTARFKDRWQTLFEAWVTG